MRNKYAKGLRITESQFRELIKLMVNDVDRQNIAILIGLHRKTVERYMALIQKRIARYCEDQSPFVDRQQNHLNNPVTQTAIEASQRGFQLPQIIFGFSKLDDKIFTEIISGDTTEQIRNIMSGDKSSEEKITSESLRRFDGLAELGRKNYYKVDKVNLNRDEQQFLDSFWAFYKKYISKLVGFVESNFYLDLKECEFRFNNRDGNLYSILLKMFRDRPIIL